MHLTVSDEQSRRAGDAAPHEVEGGREAVGSGSAERLDGIGAVDGSLGGETAELVDGLYVP